MEAEFFVAERLGMTVGALRRDMSADEFLRWVVFFGRKAQRDELRG